MDHQDAAPRYYRHWNKHREIVKDVLRASAYGCKNITKRTINRLAKKHGVTPELIQEIDNVVSASIESTYQSTLDALTEGET